MLRQAFLIGMLLLSASFAHAEVSWKWVSGNAITHAWYQREGTAEVRMSGKSVHAQLFEEEELRFTLEGTVSDGAVTVSVRTHNSDVGDETMTGTYAVGEDGLHTFKAIIVQNKWAFIALTTTEQKSEQHNKSLQPTKTR